MKLIDRKKIMRATFTTRKDFTFIINRILLAYGFICFCAFLYVNKMYLSAAISLLLSIFFISFLLNNKIILEQYYISVRFGIFSYKIKYKDIKDIYLDYNIFGFLASSHFKVGIKTSKHKSKLFDTFLSPMDRADFIYEVNKRR